MKRWIIVFSLCYLFLSQHILAERMLPYFVSTQWLAEHLNDKDIIVLQVGFTRNEYKYGHIPTARFLWFNSLAPSTHDFSTEMPSLPDAKNVLEQLGINNSSKIIVVFAGQNVATTMRMLLALTYFGFGDHIALLDGGLEMWKLEGRTVSRETPEVKRTILSVKIVSDVITDADWIKQNLSNPRVTIVDARTKNFYDGNGGGIARQGHIKGAKSVVFNTVMDSTNKIKSAAELQKLFDSAGVAKGTTVVTYCHVGQQATLVYYVAKYLGYDAKVYDGSFEDWNMRDESYPVEKIETIKK